MLRCWLLLCQIENERQSYLYLILYLARTVAIYTSNAAAQVAVAVLNARDVKGNEPERPLCLWQQLTFQMKRYRDDQVVTSKRETRGFDTMDTILFQSSVRPSRDIGIGISNTSIHQHHIFDGTSKKEDSKVVIHSDWLVSKPHVTVRCGVVCVDIKRALRFQLFFSIPCK